MMELYLRFLSAAVYFTFSENKMEQSDEIALLSVYPPAIFCILYRDYSI
jgi:hypothetical protein